VRNQETKQKERYTVSMAVLGFLFSNKLAEMIKQIIVEEGSKVHFDFEAVKDQVLGANFRRNYYVFMEDQSLNMRSNDDQEVLSDCSFHGEIVEK
jgi:hypothetical protein